MPILSAHIVPHPPIIIPTVGRGREAEIQKTIDSYHALAKEIAEQQPETIVIISPHATTYADYFHISGGSGALGSFARFGAAETHFSVIYDTDLVAAVSQAANKAGLPSGCDGERSSDLDHGTMVPLYFIQQYLPSCKIVRMSISGLGMDEHYNLGTALRDAIADKKVVLIASGDLSHRLTDDGPYSFHESGPKFDKIITEAMSTADFDRIFEFDESFLSEAAECGLRPFAVLAGALAGTPIEVEFRSYEGPFGVGYCLCSYRALSLHTYLARHSLEYYIQTGRYMDCPEGLPEALMLGGHGAFVSIKKHGLLRGCIGTITGVQENLALEIIANAVSAGTKDPRFPPIVQSELNDLNYSVDVLMDPEPVEDLSDLDEQKYGVIVTSGFKRGLLLPNLDGVNSVAEQLAIALEKGGIRPNESYKIQRFEVVRYK